MAIKQIGFKLKLTNLKTASGSIAHQALEEDQLIITSMPLKLMN